MNQHLLHPINCTGDYFYFCFLVGLAHFLLTDRCSTGTVSFCILHVMRYRYIVLCKCMCVFPRTHKYIKVSVPWNGIELTVNLH